MTPCENCDCPRCRCTCHEDDYGATKRERSAYNLGNHAGFSLGLRIGATFGEKILGRYYPHIKGKKGAGAAALLILLIGLIIILTLLFMPPSAREALLNGMP